MPWQEKVANRVIFNYGCPYFTGQALFRGFNDLATTHPQLAKQWHPTKNGALRPTDVTGGTKQTAWWIGVCGHEWETKILIRARDGSDCPYCANQKLLVGFNDVLSDSVCCPYQCFVFSNSSCCQMRQSQSHDGEQ